MNARTACPFVAILFIVALLPTASRGHARMGFPGTDAAGNVGDVTPRNSNAGIKNGPCGGVARGNNPKVLTAGNTITLRWVETIQHPGKYHFEFSPAGDTNWVRWKTVDDDQDNQTLPHAYSTTVTIPANTTPCTACTFRLVQEMTDRNPPTFYYSCGDIQINAAPGASPNPSPDPGTGSGGNIIPDELNTGPVEGCGP